MRRPRRIIQSAVIAALFAVCFVASGCGLVDDVSANMERPRAVITSVKVFEPNLSLTMSDEAPEGGGTGYVSPIGGDYYRSKLDASSQAVYDQLRSGFQSFTNDIDIDDCSPEVAEKCYKYVLYDAPEIFWVDTSYQYMITQDRSTVVSIQPDFIYSEGDATEANERLQSEAKSLLGSMPPTCATDYDKARYLFEQVSALLRYDEAMADTQDLGTVIDQKVSVCGGYAKLYQYLCRQAGIDCTYIVGHADVDGEEILHAWNMLDLDGTVCYADATWGDKDEMLPVDLSWLGLTYASMSASHTPLEPGIAVEEANDPRYEIWAMSRSYYEIYDEQTVLARMVESACSGEPSLVMKFATPEALTMAEAFIKDSSYPATHVYECYPEAFPVAYTEGVYKAYKIDDLNAIKIIWRH